MGSPKTVDRNATTFVPIGWSVGFCGVKMRVELAGPKRIDSQGPGSRIGLINEPNAGSRHKVHKQLQTARASCIREPYKTISEETAKETTKQMAELGERYPDAFIHDAVDPRVTLCKVMAHSDCRDGLTWTQADSNGRINGNSLTPALKGRQNSLDVSFA
jgi:hypothetical protein